MVNKEKTAETKTAKKVEAGETKMANEEEAGETKMANEETEATKTANKERQRW